METIILAAAITAVSIFVGAVMASVFISLFTKNKYKI